MKRGLLIIVFSLVILIGISHILGSLFFFYWDSFWFDEMMHFLGGLTMGFLFLWLWHVSGLFGRDTPSKKAAMLGALIFSLFISVGWEFFEFAHKIASPIGGNYPLDTFNDLLFDFLGATVAGFVGRIRKFYE